MRRRPTEKLALRAGNILRDGAILHFDQLHFLRQIGSGANGIVFEAKDTALDRSVAVKIWNLRIDDPSSRALFEVRKLVGLSHPLLVTAHQFGILEGHPYAVMELVSGCTLGDWLALKPRSARERCAVWRLLSTALRFIYGGGSLHGDPHTGNVLVYDDQHGYCRPHLPSYLAGLRIGVKLADTGTSRVWRSSSRFRERELRLLLETAQRIFVDPSPKKALAEHSDRSLNGVLDVVDYFAHIVGSYSDLPAASIEAMRKAAQRTGN